MLTNYAQKPPLDIRVICESHVDETMGLVPNHEFYDN
jgi:hypothetical protein